MNYKSLIIVCEGVGEMGKLWALGFPCLPSFPHPSAALCIPATARPLGSFMLRKASSHASASAVLHATLGTLGTERAAESLGKCSAKMLR